MIAPFVLTFGVGAILVFLAIKYGFPKKFVTIFSVGIGFFLIGGALVLQIFDPVFVFWTILLGSASLIGLNASDGRQILFYSLTLSALAILVTLPTINFNSPESWLAKPILIFNFLIIFLLLSFFASVAYKVFSLWRERNIRGMVILIFLVVLAVGIYIGAIKSAFIKSLLIRIFY